MAYIIEDNSFSQDSYDLRSTRLYQLSHNIDTYAAELDIEAGLLSWAQNAFEVWDEARGEHSVEMGEKDEAFQTSQEKDIELLEKYVALKELLIARYGEKDQALKDYGIKGATPRSRGGVQSATNNLLHGNQRHLDESDPKALPLSITASLQTLYDGSFSSYDSALNESEESAKSTVDVAAYFDVDSAKLRQIYTWIAVAWGKKDPRLIVLGFVQAKDKGGGRPGQCRNLAFNDSLGKFTWDSAAGSTSYQLALKHIAAPDWEEAYSGPNNYIDFTPGPGRWIFRVRARNANGYGEWSDELTLGLAAPGNPSVYYTTATQSNTLSFATVEGAENYGVYQCIVAIGEPPGEYYHFADFPGSPVVMSVGTGHQRYWYYVTAKKGVLESVKSEEVYVDTD